MTGNYYISKKLGIRIYTLRKSGMGILWFFIFIFIIYVSTWFYSDCWISHWLNLYWNGIQSQKINDEFLYLWIEPFCISLVGSIILAVVLLVIIDLIWELLRGMDLIISIIKRLCIKIKTINIVLILLLGLVSFTSCKRYDRMVEELMVIKAIENEKTMDPSFQDPVKVKQICEFLLQIKDNNSTKQEIEWEDIARSMLLKPDSVVFNVDMCKTCQTSRTQLYFRSPDWTWEKLCGRAGHLVICPVCKTQDFHLEIAS